MGYGEEEAGELARERIWSDIPQSAQRKIVNYFIEQYRPSTEKALVKAKKKLSKFEHDEVRWWEEGKGKVVLECPECGNVVIVRENWNSFMCFNCGFVAERGVGKQPIQIATGRKGGKRLDKAPKDDCALCGVVCGTLGDEDFCKTQFDKLAKKEITEDQLHNIFSAKYGPDYEKKVLDKLAKNG